MERSKSYRRAVDGDLGGAGRADAVGPNVSRSQVFAETGGLTPAKLLAVAAENMIASALDLECASGNDQSFSHSPMRRTARLMP